MTWGVLQVRHYQLLNNDSVSNWTPIHPRPHYLTPLKHVRGKDKEAIAKGNSEKYIHEKTHEKRQSRLHKNGHGVRIQHFRKLTIDTIWIRPYIHIKTSI